MSPTRPRLAAGEPTRADIAAFELLERNEAERLKLVRSRAEKWVGGLAALTGLVGTVLVVKAPESVRTIESTYRVALAVLIALGFLTLAWGTYRAYQAAFGDLGHIEEIQRQPITGLAERLAEAQRKVAHRANAQLRQAAVATFCGVAVLGAGIGTSWFAPVREATMTVCLVVDGRPIAAVSGSHITVQGTTATTTITRCS